VHGQHARLAPRGYRGACGGNVDGDALADVLRSACVGGSKLLRLHERLMVGRDLVAPAAAVPLSNAALIRTFMANKHPASTQ
jgi:hypothetical protein